MSWVYGHGRRIVLVTYVRLSIRNTFIVYDRVREVIRNIGVLLVWGSLRQLCTCMMLYVCMYMLNGWAWLAKANYVLV